MSKNPSNRDEMYVIEPLQPRILLSASASLRAAEPVTQDDTPSVDIPAEDQATTDKIAADETEAPDEISTDEVSTDPVATDVFSTDEIFTLEVSPDDQPVSDPAQDDTAILEGEADHPEWLYRTLEIPADETADPAADGSQAPADGSTDAQTLGGPNVFFPLNASAIPEKLTAEPTPVIDLLAAQATSTPVPTLAPAQPAQPAPADKPAATDTPVQPPLTTPLTQTAKKDDLLSDGKDLLN